MQETLYSSSSTNHSPTQGPRMPFWQRPKQWSMAETGLSHQNLLQWAKISFEFDKLKSVMCTMCIHMYLAHWEIFWKEDDFFCLLKRTYIYIYCIYYKHAFKFRTFRSDAPRKNCSILTGHRRHCEDMPPWTSSYLACLEHQTPYSADTGPGAV